MMQKRGGVVLWMGEGSSYQGQNWLSLGKA